MDWRTSHEHGRTTARGTWLRRPRSSQNDRAVLAAFRRIVFEAYRRSTCPEMQRSARGPTTQPTNTSGGYPRPGATILSIGDRTGRTSLVAAHLAGTSGSVVGVLCNELLLQDARMQAAVRASRRLGYPNLAFRWGSAVDLRLDVEQLDRWLRANPVRDAKGLRALEREKRRLRREEPLVRSGTADLVACEFSLNQLRGAGAAQALKEIRRALKPDGRIVLCELVTTSPMARPLRRDLKLWSSLLAGAHETSELVAMLATAGFDPATISTPALPGDLFVTVEGVDFRAAIITAKRYSRADRDGH